MNEKKPILLLDDEGQLLATYDLDKRDQAYQYAEQLEEMGINVTLREPSLPETLLRSLGASEEDTETLKKEIDEEIAAHDTPCCGTINNATRQ